MADSDVDKGANSSFFRKVVKFVANPSTDWAEIASNTQDEALQGGYAKSELKAMIERKRRNDFVRKREFDLLRKIRREGLPADGLAGMGASSELDDSEPRSQGVARADDAAVKAKIDEIEQQMEGESNARRAPANKPPAFYAQPTERGGFDETSPPLNEPFQIDPPAAAAPAANRRSVDPAPVTPVPSLTPQPLPARKPPPGVVPVVNEVAWEATAAYTHKADNTALGGIPSNPLGPTAGKALGATASAAPAAAAAKPAVPAAAPAAARVLRHGSSDFTNPFDVEVNEIAHDPELDEAVISFANAEYEACERAITTLIAPDAARANHAETWLVLFDLYRATGQQQRFESLVLDYVQRFGWSAPQWFSIPALVAADVAQRSQNAAAPSHAAHVAGNIGWLAPAHIDPDAVKQLDAATLKMPMPWLIDWQGVTSLDVAGCDALARLLRHWATQKIDMRWVGVEHLLAVLSEGAPSGSRDADPAYWLLRLEALRLVNRPDQFDEVAIDYCVTYEVSPPSWEHSKCTVKLADGSGVSLAARSILPDASSVFPESALEEADARTASVELSGQLVGDIGAVLKQLEGRLGEAAVVSINCARLIRMDFIAAGDLLNWVLARRNEQRLVHFDDAHRLLGLFFNAMGINEHARVKVRNV